MTKCSVFSLLYIVFGIICCFTAMPFHNSIIHAQSHDIEKDYGYLTLNRTEERMILELARQMGFVDIRKISTTYMVDIFRCVCVEEHEEIHKRTIQWRTLCIHSQKWRAEEKESLPKHKQAKFERETTPDAKAIYVGHFWTSEEDIATVTLTRLLVNGREIRVHSLTNLTFQKAESIVQHFVDLDFSFSQEYQTYLQKEQASYKEAGEWETLSNSAKQAFINPFEWIVKETDLYNVTSLRYDKDRDTYSISFGLNSPETASRDIDFRFIKGHIFIFKIGLSIR